MRLNSHLHAEHLLLNLYLLLALFRLLLGKSLDFYTTAAEEEYGICKLLWAGRESHLCKGINIMRPLNPRPHRSFPSQSAKQHKITCLT